MLEILDYIYFPHLCELDNLLTYLEYIFPVTVIIDRGKKDDLYEDTL